LINIYDAKAHLSHVVSEVERTGRRVVICRNRKPVADLVPHRAMSDPFEVDPALKGVVIHGDPAEALPPEDWPESLK
jgi:prevent-host-death family protein